MQLKYGIDGCVLKEIFHYLWLFPQFIVMYIIALSENYYS
jgi:hypothetical protein